MLLRPESGPCLGATGSSITHVIVLVEENKSETIVKKASMPYLKSLTAQCGLATNAHNLTHPSSGNYFGLTSGQVQGGAWSKDGGPGKYPQSQDNIFHQLDQAGQGWGVFAQSMPSNCYTGNAGAYYVRHTAAPYFDDINGRGGSTDNSCATNDVPLGDPQAGTGNNLYNALYGIDGARLPAFSLIAPDVCHDLHGPLYQRRSIPADLDPVDRGESRLRLGQRGGPHHLGRGARSGRDLSGGLLGRNDPRQGHRRQAQLLDRGRRREPGHGRGSPFPRRVQPLRCARRNRDASRASRSAQQSRRVGISQRHVGPVLSGLRSQLKPSGRNHAQPARIERAITKRLS